LNIALSYASFDDVTLNAGSGGNTIRVRSTLLGSTTNVNAGAGDDEVTVASGPLNPNRLDDIGSILTIDGQGGDENTIVLDDSGSPIAGLAVESQRGVGRRGQLKRVARVAAFYNLAPAGNFSKDSEGVARIGTGCGSSNCR
jgi:hypothetical protein